jgi:quinol monooxygenase YgiN
MSEVVVVGSFKAQSGKEDEGLEAFKALVAPTHAEDGCILYALHQGSDDPSRLAFVERWESRELLDAHLQSPHVSAILERADELFGDSADIVVYEAVPDGEERKGSLAAHAGG